MEMGKKFYSGGCITLVQTSEFDDSILLCYTVDGPRFLTPDLQYAMVVHPFICIVARCPFNIFCWKLKPSPPIYAKTLNCICFSDCTERY